jgi:parallel beta-helix repeat protein
MADTLSVTAFVVASDAPSDVITAATAAKVYLGDLIQLCDGTDDDVNINDAITALPAGGGVVQLSDGTFDIAHKVTVAQDNVTIQGQGESTVLEANSTLPTGEFAIQTGGDGWVIRDLVVDGDALAYASGGPFMILVDDANCQVLNVEIKNGPMHGIYIQNPADNVLVSECYIHDNGQSGITLSADGAQLTGARIVNNVTNSNGLNTVTSSQDKQGIHIEGHSTYYVVGALVSGNASTNNETVGIGVNLAKDCEFANNRVTDNKGAGIGSLTSERLTVTGNTILNNGTDTAAGYGNGVEFGDAGTTGVIDSTITGNVIDTHTDFGIAVRATSARVTITGNTIQENTRVGVIIAADSEHVAVTNNNIHSAVANSDGVIVGDATKITIVGNTISPARYATLFEWGAADITVGSNLIESCVVAVRATQDSANIVVDGNRIDTTYGLDIHNTVSNVSLTSNDLTGTTNPIAWTSTSLTWLIRDNRGFATEVSGVATIVDPATSVTVTHGMASISGTAPALKDFQATPTEDINTASRFWISNAGATTFDINIDSAAGSDKDFSWRGFYL